MRRDSKHNNITARILALIATCLLLLPLMVQPVRQVIFSLRSNEIRYLDSKSEKIEKMVFTVNQYSKLNFTRSQKEFIYRGNMYDIHSITKKGNQVILLVLWDKPESHLLMAFQAAGKTESSTAPGKIGMGFLPYFKVAGFTPDFTAPAVNPHSGEPIQNGYTDPYSIIFSPPPELLT